MRIGLPRTLWYYTYGPFWQRFFTALGHKVVLSPHTTRAVLDKGIVSCVSEACLPIKVYFGHLEELAGKVDYLFVPRLVCLSEDRVFCPKFLGLPDMVRHGGMELPKLLEVRLDRRKGKLFLHQACLEVGRQLGASWWQVTRAFAAALNEQVRYCRSLLGGARPAGVKPPQRRSLSGPAGRPLRVALMGYPYLIFDDYINLGLLEKLAAFGVEYRTIDTLKVRDMRRQNHRFPKRPFWHFSDLVARAGFHFLGPAAGEVDGVIHVTAFACGPDAVVDKLLEMEAERRRQPYLNITLDEQSGEAGYMTRLEAFVEMLHQREVRAHAQ